MSTRAIVAVWTLGLLVAATAIAVVLTSDASNKVATILLAAPSGLAFIASGLIARSQRPGNRTGTLLLLVGFTWFAGAFKQADSALIFTLSVALSDVFFGFLGHLLLAFPTGRLETRADRFTAVGIYVLVAVAAPTVMLFEDFHDETCDGTCPENLLAVAPNDSVSTALQVVFISLAVAVLGALIAIFVRRWRRATPALRRALAPVFATASLLIVIVAAGDLVAIFSEPVAGALEWALLVSLLAVPLAFLFGLLRTRLGGTVGRLVAELGAGPPPGHVRDVIARALGDPSLELAYSVGDGKWVNLEGRPMELPPSGSSRLATVVEREGRPVAALVHDPSLEHDPARGTVAAAAALALDNERLQAELRARLDELSGSRARIVQAGDEERRRLERNLHDGAQQHLVSLSLTLRLAQARLLDDQGAARELLDGAAAELALALEELRELASGIHPAVLAQRGLGPALEALAARAPVPVSVETPEERLPQLVEATAFYVVAESLTNVAKYADASAVAVRVAHDDGRLVVEVEDDGVGGADPSLGSGLTGLTDRVAALHGKLEIDSPPGRGTRVRAEIPCP